MSDQNPPLVVDLDGTLLKVDTLHEGFVLLVCRRPLQALAALWLLLTKGRAAMKAKISTFDVLDIETLPVREDLARWLGEQADAGRELHLVTAADHSVAQRIAARVGIFVTAVGSDGTDNLKGPKKADYLTATFPRGFSYAGDSAADLEVWKHCTGIVLVNASRSVERRAENLGRPVEARFERNGGRLRAFLKQCRLHQWSKNALVFLPILLAHHFTDVEAWVNSALAFFGLSIAASATYIINDLFDLSADRVHATKRNRPLASGNMSILLAAVVVPAMFIAGFALAFAVGWQAAVVLGAYLVLTLAYSIRLKRVPLLDTAVIGMLFTLRIVLGNVAAHLLPSPWLLAFSVTLFFSLAMAKRQSEIAKKSQVTGSERIAGRGYEPGDVMLTLVYGITSGVASLVVLMLYTTNGIATVLYRNPAWLWAIPLLVYLWQMRVWLLAHRGALNDDPIVFALKDRWSLLLGAGCAVAFYLAL